MRSRKSEMDRLVDERGEPGAASTYQHFAAMEYRIAQQWAAGGIVGAVTGPERGGWALHMHLSAVFSDRARVIMGVAPPHYPKEH